jgi:hypothetical protein
VKQGVGGQGALFPATGALDQGPSLQHMSMSVSTARAAKPGRPAQLVHRRSALFDGPI